MTKKEGFRIEIPVHIKSDRRARKVLATGEAPEVEDAVPRMARLLALAHKWEAMVRRGEVKGYVELARRHGLSRARVTQITNLTLLAPAAQETTLFERHDASPVAATRRWLHNPLWNDHISDR